MSLLSLRKQNTFVNNLFLKAKEQKKASMASICRFLTVTQKDEVYLCKNAMLLDVSSINYFSERLRLSINLCKFAISIDPMSIQYFGELRNNEELTTLAVSKNRYALQVISKTQFDRFLSSNAYRSIFLKEEKQKINKKLEERKKKKLKDVDTYFF